MATNLNSRQNSVCSGLKFSSESKLFGGCHLCSRATSATLDPSQIVGTVVDPWLMWPWPVRMRELPLMISWDAGTKQKPLCWCRNKTEVLLLMGMHYNTWGCLRGHGNKYAIIVGATFGFRNVGFMSWKNIFHVLGQKQSLRRPKWPFWAENKDKKVEKKRKTVKFSKWL